MKTTINSYDQSQLEQLAKNAAMQEFVVAIYRGTVHSQKVQWAKNGTMLEVITYHTPDTELKR